MSLGLLLELKNNMLHACYLIQTTRMVQNNLHVEKRTLRVPPSMGTAMGNARCPFRCMEAGRVSVVGVYSVEAGTFQQEWFGRSWEGRSGYHCRLTQPHFFFMPRCLLLLLQLFPLTQSIFHTKSTMPCFWWLQDLNISRDTIKVLEENIGRKIWHSKQQYFHHYVP